MSRRVISKKFGRPNFEVIIVNSIDGRTTDIKVLRNHYGVVDFQFYTSNLPFV